MNDIVVIGGCQRSGTTLFHQLLSSHPDVHGVMTDSAVFNHYESYAEQSGMSEPKTAEQMRTILTFMLTKTNVQKWELLPSEVIRHIGAFPPSWDSVFLCLLAGIHEKYRSPVTALKNPGGEFAFFGLRELFENNLAKIRFIYCLRNPFDTYRSWKHRSTSWFDQDRPESHPLLWSATWLKSTQQIMDFRSRFPDIVHVVRFTDLLTSPAETTSKLCAFLGLEDRSTQMISTIEATPNSSFRDSNLPKVMGGVVNVRARVVDDLSDWESDAIRAACGQRAATFGYDLGEPSQNCNVSRVMHDVALEMIPTSEIVRYGLRLMARRAWNRCFNRPMRCLGQEVSTRIEANPT